MKKSALSLLLLSLFALLFSLPKNALASTVTLNPTADSYIDSRVGDTNTNYSFSTSLSTGTADDGTKFYNLFKFDLSSIPSSAIINSATLRLYQSSHSWNGAGPNYGVYRILENWAENTVTWNNKPSAIFFSSSSINMDGASGYKEWDVKELVQEYVVGDYQNYGFYVKPNNDTIFVSLINSVNNASNKPQLVINYTSMVLIDPVILHPEIIPLLDITPPVITNISASAGVTSATVTWTTNEKSNSYVDFGLTNAYGNTLGQGDDVTSHSVSLSGLSTLKTYHYRVRSKDSHGNEATSGDKTFFTLILLNPWPGATAPSGAGATSPSGTGNTAGDSGVGATTPSSGEDTSSGTSGTSGTSGAGSTETNGGTEESAGEGSTASNGTETKETVGQISSDLLGKILPIALGGILVAIVLTILALIKATKGSSVPVVPVVPVKKKKKEVEEDVKE